MIVWQGAWIRWLLGPLSPELTTAGLRDCLADGVIILTLPWNFRVRKGLLLYRSVRLSVVRVYSAARYVEKFDESRNGG